MLEPIQGEGGIHAAEESYLRSVAKLCEQHDWMLILDEIQTGNGRTGKLFTCMHYNIQPDVLTTAKGLANGIPIGACLISKRAKDLFKPGNHGLTFGGNPLACATALTVLEVIERDKICDKVTKNSAILMEQLIKNLGEHPNVKAIRGKGFMIGIELDRPANDMRLLGLKNGVLFNITADTVVRLLPPLIINEEEIAELVNRLTLTINQFTQS
jgi:acetylornithine aminotransferase